MKVSIQEMLENAKLIYPETNNPSLLTQLIADGYKFDECEGNSCAECRFDCELEDDKNDDEEFFPLLEDVLESLSEHKLEEEEDDIISIDSIERVIFNPPATIVIFKDGRKTIAKTMEQDEFQPEMGFAMVMMKEIFETRGEYKRWIQQWMKEE